MPTYIRWREEGATYFFTVVTYRRRPLFDKPLARRLLHVAMHSVRARLPFELPAIVLLPDHLHCLMVLPEGDDDFPNRWREIKSAFTHDYLGKGGRELAVSLQGKRQRRRGFWQPRFWEHRIRDEEDYIRHRDYIHINPVKHGHVNDPCEWPFSSFHRHVELGMLDPDWPGEKGIDLPDIPE